MIKLKNISKYYYSKGVIATGFTKVNLEFKIGEFVAITGESGSGKSTLLNVISGLDSYEEGEMFIDGKETSHYLEKDWEIYRRKNIGNIYQNFNLINSYTVSQNVDLILMLNGISKDIRKKRVSTLLKRVGMTKFSNTKVSKLSGGQKQRVAIARALAKDVPIIIADEPTGSLDKESAINVIKLLKEIAKDKLVIIVTHNYDQVSDYVTRKITMHDGRVLEDRHIKNIEEEKVREEAEYRNMSIFNQIKLGVRNTFNVLPKFILLFLVYSFIVSALMGEYSYFKKSEYESSKNGINYLFTDLDDKRIVFNKVTKEEISEEDINKIKNINNVSYVMENDAIVDNVIVFFDDNEGLWINGSVFPIDLFNGSVDVGRIPEADGEIIVECSSDDYTLTEEVNNVLNKKLHLQEEINTPGNNNDYTIVGIKYNDSIEAYNPYKFYLRDENLLNIQFQTHQKYSDVVVNLAGINHKVDYYSNEYKLMPNNWVTLGTAIISEEYNTQCEKENCINNSFNVKVSNQYYTESLNLTIKKAYNEKNISYILELPDYSQKDFQEKFNGCIYINPLDYNKLFNKGTYQMSVYVDDVDNLALVNKELKNMGYKTLMIKDTLVQSGSVQIIKIFKFIVTIILVVVLFLISYFVIKIILKSRNGYYSVLRMLGSNKNVVRNLLIIELFVFSNLSYLVFLCLAEANRFKIINIGFVDTVNKYFGLNDYIILYLILIIMSVLVSFRYARNLFKKSVMSSYREEV